MRVLTDDHKLDVSALVPELSTEVGHFGALGSRRTRAERTPRLRTAGITERQLSPGQGRIVLTHGATAEEAATSTCGEISATHPGPAAAPGPDTRGPRQ